MQLSSRGEDLHRLVQRHLHEVQGAILGKTSNPSWKVKRGDSLCNKSGERTYDTWILPTYPFQMRKMELRDSTVGPDLKFSAQR